ncbi:MAG: putative dynein heavy chain, partial [Streblomastix strix]
MDFKQSTKLISNLSDPRLGPKFPRIKKLNRKKKIRLKNAGGTKGSGNNKDSFTEFIPNTTIGIVASLLELFTSLADTYASTHSSKIADAQYQQRMDAVTGAGGRSGRRGKKGDQKKAERENIGKQVIVFVHDLKTPTPEIYFAQPPIEFLKQCIDQKGIYDRKKLTFNHLTETVFVAACGPPGGGRHVITQRLTKCFHTIGMPQVGTSALTQIFSAIITGFLTNQKPILPQTVQELAKPLVDATVFLYNKACTTFLPTPS